MAKGNKTLGSDAYLHWGLAFGPCLFLLNNPKEADMVNAALPFSPHPATSMPVCRAFIFISSLLPPSSLRRIPVQACQSVTEVSTPSPNAPPPSTSLALSWTSACGCQNTDSASPCSESIRSHLYRKQSPRFILPITSEHLLFKFQIIFLGVNSVPAILGVYSLHLQLSHLICMLLESYVHTLAHTNVHLYPCTHTYRHTNDRTITATSSRRGYHWFVCYMNNKNTFKDNLNYLGRKKEIGNSLDIFVCFFRPFPIKI